MPNVTIPTTSQSQTLTGDNGVQTVATFTANALEPAFFSRSGVGLRGSNYDPFGEAALTVDFSEPVEDVSFTIFDLDEAAGSWDDQIRILAYDPAGNPIPITYTTNGTGHIAEVDGSNGELQIEASNIDAGGDDQSSIVISIAGPVGSFSIFYEDGNTTSNDNGVINVESLSFTNTVERDGTVEGTAGDDVIDGAYTGDPNADYVDNSDAILPGDTGNDDLIFGYAGNDSISAGEGDDEVYGGTGNDTIDGGNDNDLLVGDQSPDSNGDDTITGGAGNDTIYGDTFGDTGAVSESTSFSWLSLGLGDGADVSGGVTGTSANGDVNVTFSVIEEENFTYAQMETSDALYDYNGLNDNSSIQLRGGTATTSGDASTAIIDFSAANAGYFDGVENVTFGIHDIDALSGQFQDQVIIRAYDLEGNLIPVTLTPGNAATMTTSVDGDGVGTATSNGGSTAVNSVDSFLQVDIAGPVARIEIDYNNTDPAFGNHSINIGDLTFDSIAIDDSAGGGDDSLEGGFGDDTIFGQTGNDTIGLSDNFGNDVIEGGEDIGNGDVDVIDGGPLTQSVTVDYSAAETGTITNGVDTASYSEIEEIITGAGDDTVLGDVGNDTVSTGAGVDTLSGGAGDDVFDAGADDDTIDGGTGDDSITAGTGSDTVVLSNGFGNDTIAAGEDAGNTETDTLDASAVTTDITLNITSPETGTIASSGDTASFTEVEEFVLGSGDDSVTGSSGDDVVDLGQGADTINAGGGNDTIDLGEVSPGNPDQDPDVIILEDGFGNDIVSNFDAPTDDGDGTFTGIDTLDVTNLTDLTGSPVNTHDVTVGNDGSGNAVLTFPNGETLTLLGIDPVDADNPLYLNAIGIPLPDGIVTGTQGADTIDASYLGDPDGDRIDAGDELLAGEGTDDDIIVAQGGDDSITSGAGDDDIYGGDGSDTIDAGAGNDTVYGDTPDGAWYYEYYDLDPTGEPSNLEAAGFTGGGSDFDGIPTDIGYTDTLDPAAIDGADDYALKFTTVLNVTTAGDYTFSTSSDDGSKLFIDGVEVVNNDGLHGLVTVTGAPVTLSAGEHVIEIIYFENNGGNQLTATISGPDTSGASTDLATYSGLRAVTGDDIITGGAGDDTLFGGDGSDTFNVAEADDTDTITGGEDVGGADIDTLSFDSVGNGDGVTVSLSADEQGTYQVGGTGSDGTFSEIERIVGTDNADNVDLTGDTGGMTVESGAGDDVVTSDTGDDSIAGGAGQDDIVINNDFGNDTIDGGATADGTGDILDGSALTQGVTVDFTAAETGTVTNGADTLSFVEIEEIFTGSGNDTVLGDVGDDVVSTGQGADTISGGAGNDTFDAGGGNDTIDGGADNDSINAGAGRDTVFGGSGDDTIDGGNGNDVLSGGIGDDSINGGNGSDTIILEDSFGNDTIAGGENGTTVDVLDGSALTEDVVVNLSGPEAGTVTNGPDTATFSEIEEINTGSGDDTVTGGAGSDTVSTGAGADQVTFSGGDDISTGDNDDLFILTGDETGDITIDGGDEDRDGGGALLGDGDTLQLGDFADLSTLSTTTAPDGSLSGTVTLDNGSILTFSDIERIICFTPGTTIATPQGARPIETLQVGDLVVTRDHGLQPIRWIQSRTVKAEDRFAPVRIRPGAVTGLEKDLLVSPQHRMLFTGYRSELLFGEREVLMPALHLVDDKLVTREFGGEVTYIHMMFDNHEVIYADGAASESFHPGEEGLGGITVAAREELFSLFPELRSNPMGYGTTARRCLKKHEAHMLRVG